MRYIGFVALPIVVVPSFVAIEAVSAFPVNAAFIFAGSFNITSLSPLTETASPVFVADESEILIFLACPHFSVVIEALPSKEVSFIVTAVFNFVAVFAFPERAPENVVVDKVFVLGLYVRLASV